jgi:hypothetical protein
LGCLLDGRPLVGGWVGIWLGTTAKNPFHSFNGPADSQGVVVVTGDDLVSWSAAQANFALIGYVSPERGLDGSIVGEAVNLNDIDRALEAFDLFSDHVPYPPGYAESLTSLAVRLRQSSAGVLEVKVLSGDENGAFKVTARPPRAVTDPPEDRT